MGALPRPTATINTEIDLYTDHKHTDRDALRV